MTTSKNIAVGDLAGFMTQAFALSGVPERDAQVVTDNLLRAEMKGITSHGLSRFPVYLKRIQKGLVNPKPQIATTNVLPGVLSIDGDNGLGSVVMIQGLNEGMKIAEKIGICAIGIKRSNHFGISTYYCEKAADNGFISILLTNSPPATPPFGGKEPYFGTNPIAFGMPRKNKPHIIIDMATSVVARGKIIRAAQRDESIPEGWALDQDGYPTTDAKAALAGVLLPIAGPKGYALSLAVEHLAGVLTGAGYGKGVAWQYGPSEEPANVGHFLIIIKADSFIEGSKYEERTETFVSEIKNLALAPGFETIKLPGEREWEREQAILVQGISMDAELVEQYSSIAKNLNLETVLLINKPCGFYQKRRRYKLNGEASKSQCCCGEETDQQKYNRVAEIIDKYKNKEGSLIQVLHMSQNIYGYLPLELQKFIAEGMDKSLSEVSGVITFYSFFSTQPRGEHTIRVCLGTACYVRGGKKIVDRLEDILGIKVGETTEDRKYTFEVARCIGACGLAPAMMIDDVVYKQVNPDKLEAIFGEVLEAVSFGGEDVSIPSIKSTLDLDKIKRQYEQKISKYKYQVFVCGGTGCMSAHCGEVKTALEKLILENRLEDQVAVIETGCMGLCALGPVLLIMPDEIFYTEVNPEKMAKIFQAHLLNGEVKEEYTVFDQVLDKYIPKKSDIAFFRNQVKIALSNCGNIDHSSIEAYIAQDGYSAAAKAFKRMSAQAVIEELKRSGLRGRGGEGFPVGLKWETGMLTKSDSKYIVCNADEGDPKAFMARSILEGDPHVVIEGMLLAGYAVGAAKGYIYLPAEYQLAVERLGAAIEEARDHGLLGEGIFESNFAFDIEICLGVGTFIGGEETSLLASMEGKRGEPKQKPPFPVERGLFDKSTVINHVETLANVPPIIRRGAEWYTQYGTDTSKGTKVFALAGDLVNTGMVEVPMGMSLGDILFKIGGGIPNGKLFKAAQTGGPSGACISKEFLNTPLDYDYLSELGAMMGSGGLMVMNEDTCMVDRARHFLEFLQDQSCGKCLPCRVGTKRMLEIIERISKGEGQEGDIELLEELGEAIQQSAMCRLGQTAPNLVLSTIQYFRKEYDEHIQHKHCRAGACTDLFLSPCENACPADINVPGYLALISVGKYLEAYQLIKRENPFPAVCGRICTHPCESKCRRAQIDEPIAIADLKRFITDYAFEHELPVSKETVFPQKGKSIGIIGAGPSGLTCGYYLARLGYDVDVYEAEPIAGGVLAFGIPEYRLPNDILTHEINLIEQVGVNIHLNTKVGRDIPFTELREKHDAIYVATGSQISNKIGVPGEELAGVIHGLDFLRNVNLGREVKVGDIVAVIGGGNTAVDSARTALRMGAKKVMVLYRRALEDMPADLKEIYDSIEEGIEIKPLVAPVRFKGKDKIEEIECVRMELELFDASGRRRPKAKEGSQFTLKVDTVIPAVSQSLDLNFVNPNEVGITEWGTLLTNQDTLMTTREGVFSGGDAARGSDVAITAIADGKKAAVSIDLFLGGEGLLNKGEEVEFPPAANDELLEHERFPMEILSPETRKNSFQEVGKGYHKLKAIAESMRCLRCDRR